MDKEFIAMDVHWFSLGDLIDFDEETPSTPARREFSTCFSASLFTSVTSPICN